MLLATSLPAALYVATLSAYGHWLDAGEFVSVAADLGISHPPGHPLASIVLSAARLLPVGPLALRVAFVASVCMTLAAAAFFRALHRTLVAIGVSTDALALPICVGATWAFAGAHGVWLQAIRPEVYALQAMLSMIVVERLLHVETVQPSRDTRGLGEAGLAFGLSLANHHFLGFLLLPSAMGIVARVVARKGVRPLLMPVVGIVLGLSTYALLPLRALREPMLALGHPTTPSRIFWVTSAQAFQHNAGSGAPGPFGDRIADVGEILLDQLTPIGFVAALVGVLVLSRRPTGRRFGMFWGTLFVTFLLARAWLGFVRDNPDALGYLVPAFAAAIALAACVLGLGVQRLRETSKRPKLLAATAAILVASLGLAQVSRTAGVSLASFADTDAFDDALRRDLPPRAVLFAFYPQTCFRYWGGEAEEHLRPDVLVVPVPFLTYPQAIDSLAHAHPELAPVLRSYALYGRLTLPELQNLAADRPVLVEMDPLVDAPLREALAPNGLYFELLPGGTTDGDEREGRRTARRAWSDLGALLGTPTDAETRAQVVWRQYQAAVYYAGFGDLESARACIAVARRFAPRDETLVRVEQLLRDSPEGRIDLEVALSGAR